MPAKKKPEPKKGRPTKHTKQIADKICEQLAQGFTLREVCKSEEFPAESTVRLWALEDRDGFSAQYARAREIGYQTMADELLEISDDGRNDWMERNGEDDRGWVANGEHMGRSRLRVDTRKWLLSKALPKLYGEKVTTTHEAGDTLGALLGSISDMPRLK
jgi:hypothetical protein